MTHSLRSLVLALLALAASTGIAHAQVSDFFWNGAGGDANWTTATNWTNSDSPYNLNLGPPFTINFNNSTQTTNTFNANLPFNVNQLAFLSGSGSFTINQASGAVMTFGGNGNALSQILVSGGIGSQTLNFPITLAAATQFTNNGSGTLTVSGAVALGANALTVDGSAATVLGGVVSGTGGVTKTAAGTLTYTALNTYSGTTTISGGTLQVGNGGTTGALPVGGSVVNNAALVFNRSNGYTYDGAISGTGTVTKNGSGNTTLTGINSYSGITTITAGTLSIGGANGTLGTGNVTNTATGSLVFNRTGAYTYAGVISGGGNVTKTNTGTVTLTNAQTYTGPTVVNNGTLRVNGSLAAGSAVTLSGSGRLGGTGTVSGLVSVNSGGGVAPGSGGVGTLTVGTTTFQGGGNYDLDYNTFIMTGTAVPGTTHDHLLGASGATLELGTLGVGNEFNINLTDIFNGDTLGTPVSIVIATFGTINGVAAGDVTENFIFTGRFRPDFTPTVTMNLNGAAPDTLVLTFSPVPEPTTILGVAAGVMALGGAIRRRRQRVA